MLITPLDYIHILCVSKRLSVACHVYDTFAGRYESMRIEMCNVFVSTSFPVKVLLEWLAFFNMYTFIMTGNVSMQIWLKISSTVLLSKQIFSRHTMHVISPYCLFTIRSAIHPTNYIYIILYVRTHTHIYMHIMYM